MTQVPPPPPMGDPMGGAPQPQGKGMAIASLILGIVSVAMCLYWFLAIPAGVIAIVLGVIARGRGVGAGMALAGIITGALGAVLGLVVAVAVFTGGGIFDNYCEDNPDNPYCEQQGY
ncbi:DUF4190 domain-containing protein [Demequina sp.]|uniref:DUF4190 domain-containing protein n=1 Tax=Demequina sp. TaxID=2050685 RepID=UPI0025B9B1D1|nr:DUF4190 domain-containing protein [Demequina sp.]